MREIFDDGGALAAELPGYKRRDQQVTMAACVAEAIETRRHALVEGPTGTGKSIAYLIPAIAEIARGGASRAVVVTANIALQEQLIEKDLPLLSRALPWSFTYAIMKGINNYLCLAKVQSQRREGTLDLLDDVSEQAALTSLLGWSQKTTTGDRSELPIEPSPRLWSRFSTTSDSCARKKCSAYTQCFALRAREDARQAQVIVTNYHMLLADMALRELGAPGIIPAHEILICDEAHKLPDLARSVLGFEVRPGNLRQIAKRLRKLKKKKLGEKLARETEAFFTGLANFRSSKKYKTRLRLPDPVPSDGVVTALEKAHQAFVGLANGSEGDDQAKHEAFAKRCKAASMRITEAMALQRGPGAVYFLDKRNDDVNLACREVMVANRLHEGIWDCVPTVVLTSATLTTGGTFDFIVEESGLRGALELEAGSPFNYRDNVLMVIPEGPPPNDEGFSDRLVETFEQAIRATGGRTLGLFTSYRMLNYVYAALKDREWDVMCQGEAPRKLLIDRFRENVDSVLLGTESFWTGVDVAGESLSCVVIDRIPFPTPDDPVMDALRDRDGHAAFMKHYVPRAAVQLKQGFGRLVRRIDDVGVVVCADTRLVSKGYGDTFLSSLPRTMRGRDLGLIERFFAWKAGA